MRHVRIELGILLFLLAITPVFAGIAGIETMVYQNYTFLVEVNNCFGQQAFGTEISLEVKDNIARIDVSARGHLPDFWQEELNPNKKVHHVSFNLKDPVITKCLSDKSGKPVEGCNFTTDKPNNLYFGFQYGFMAEFPKAGYEKISACNFIVYCNGKEVDSPAQVTYLSAKESKWQLEVVVGRDLLDISGNNNFEIVIFDCLHSQPDVAHLARVADDYNRHVEMAGSVSDEAALLTIQDRLESDARVLNEYFSLMDNCEKREILSRLPEEGDLARSLKSIAAFAELHR